jgi:hypothetical protein
MTNNPILDELHATRERLLAESGGTITGLLDRLRADQAASKRPKYKPSKNKAMHRGDEVRRIGSWESLIAARWPLTLLRLGPWMIFGVITILLGGFVAAMNWYSPFQSQRENRHVSMVPLIGAGLIGVGIYSLTGSLLWSLIAIPLDLGTLFFVLGLPWLFNEFWQTSRFNAVAKFNTNDNGREIVITLYKNGGASINQEYNGTVGPQEHGAIPCSRGFAGKWKFVDDEFLLTELSGGRELKLVFAGNSYVSSESNVESDAKNHTLMNNLIFEQTKNRIAD